MNEMEKQNMLEKFKQRFGEIKNSDSDMYIKTVRLAALMTDLEGTYGIPAIGAERIAAFKRAFPEVMNLYREVSLERKF